MQKNCVAANFIAWTNLSYHVKGGERKRKIQREEDPSTTKQGSCRLWSNLDYVVCHTTSPDVVASCAEWLMLISIDLAKKTQKHANWCSCFSPVDSEKLRLQRDLYFQLYGCVWYYILEVFVFKLVWCDDIKNNF